MTSVHDAARRGDTERLAMLLAAGADPDGHEAGDRPPLVAAAAAGQPAALDLLLANGAQPDPATADGESALYVAAARGFTEVVARLLAEPDVDPNRRSERGWSPLTAAGFAGHAPVVRLLLDDPRLRATSRDAQGRTALWWAATGGNAETALSLAEDRTTVRLADDDGIEPAEAAAAAGHPGLADELRRLAEAAETPPDPGAQAGGPDDDRYELPAEPPPGRVIREPGWRLREGR